ncbi:MAG: DUF3810 domain-containing protein [Aureispira sp.]
MPNRTSILPTHHQRQTIWILLGLAAIVLRFIFSWQPTWCEAFYSRGLYPYLHEVLHFLFSWLPFPAVYLFFVGVGIWLITVAKRYGQHRKRKKAGVSLEGSYWKGFFAFLMSLVFWFLFLWGYNYARVPMHEQLGLEIPEAMDYQAIWKEAQYIKTTCIATRAAIVTADTQVLEKDHYPTNLEETMRRSLKKVLARNGYDTSWQVRGRFLYPGTLLRSNSSGVYFPFVGEGNIDGGIHYISQPFTMAHELAHGYGFGDEAVCNFWGFMACIESEHPAIRYSGYLMYWRYVYGALMEFMTEEDYELERATISRGMHNDMEAIYANMDNFPPFIPFLQPAVYDVFLKVQGVEEGIESYDRMVLLVSSWRKQETGQE